MSEIDNLYAQISDCESKIYALRKEESEGYDFVSMIKSGAEDSENAVCDKEKKKTELYSVESESTFAYALGDNVQDNYGSVRKFNIQYGFEEIIDASNRRLRDIEYEIDSLNITINNCRNRISQILEEMERQRRLLDK